MPEAPLAGPVFKDNFHSEITRRPHAGKCFCAKRCQLQNKLEGELDVRDAATPAVSSSQAGRACYTELSRVRG